MASSEYTLYKSLTLNEDGTCIVDNENANWKIEDDSTDESTLYIGIYKNHQIIYAASFRKNSDSYLLLRPVYRQGGVVTQPNNHVIFVKDANTKTLAFAERLLGQ